MIHDPLFKIHAGMRKSFDHAAAAIVFGGDDEGRRHPDADSVQFGQVVGLVTEMDQIIGPRLGLVDERDGLLRIIAQHEVQLVGTELLFLGGEGSHNTGNEVIKILQPKSPGDEVPQKALRNPMNPLGRGFLIHFA